MTHTVEILVLLLVVLAAAAWIAGKLKIPPSILLVITGVGLALVPSLPAIEIEPEIVLLLVLPPIIYSSSVAMSWREFRFNLRPIALLAVGCVVFTTVAVAASMHYLLGTPWQIGFVIGAIVSPPDAVAPLSIARRLKLPKRILIILEGEGLANDATALILYRFAVAAVSTGAFSPGQATGTFAAIVAGEIVWGVGAGWLMLRLRKWARDPRIEITLSIVTPFVAYWPPEQAGGSGVLATVVAGLYISWNGQRLISAATRLQGIFFWDLFIYLIEGMVFLITGLQARTLIERIGHSPSHDLLATAGVVCAVVILARFIWVFPAIYIPRWISPPLRKRDPSPPWQATSVIAFTGIRGVVSLAAALAIPFTTEAGEPFPGRDLILFLTFSVILVTLVGQGLLLPTVIRWLGLSNAGARERQQERTEEREARRLALEAVIARLEEIRTERGLTKEELRPLHMHHNDRLKHVVHQTDGDDGHRKTAELHDEIELLLIGAEREEINKLFRDGKLTDEARRRIERELDLREADLANQTSET